MTLKRRLDRLAGSQDQGEMAMTDAERARATLEANCIIGFEPDLVLVERQDCQPGDAGQLLYLFARERTLWHQGREREAERTRARTLELERRAAAQGRTLREPEQRDVELAIARALRRLGREPTPPRIKTRAEAWERGER